MRVALVIERFQPSGRGGGGNERSTLQIAQELCDREHDVTLITGSAPPHLDLPGIQVDAMSPTSSGSLVRLFRFARFARQRLTQSTPEGGFDTAISMTMAVPAPVLQPRGGTIRETLLRNIAMRQSLGGRLKKRAALALDPKQQTLLAMERRTLRDPAVRRIVAVSDYVRRQLVEHYAVDETRIDVIPNAAVMPDIDNATRQRWRASIRDGLHVPDDATLFVFAAQNPRLKGFDTLMRALRRLADAGTVRPVVLLAGPFGYAHQQAIAAMGLRDRVRFVMQTRHMPALYAAADATVLPTYFDPSSKVIIESLMMSTPAITTAFNGAADFILPGEGEEGGGRGVVIDDPADDAALAAAMTQIADADRHRAMAAACDGLSDTLSMRRHVDRLEQVLRDTSR